MTTTRIIPKYLWLIFFVLIGVREPFLSSTGGILPDDNSSQAGTSEATRTSSRPLQQTPEELAAVLAAELLLSPMPYYVDLPVILR